MQIKNKTIQSLLARYKEIALLGNVNALLNWDLNVNIPPRGGLRRSEQSSFITKLITDRWYEKEFRILLEKAATEKNLTIEEKAIVRNLQRGAKFFYAIPQELVIKKEEVTSKAFLVWKQAKEENNFSLFKPHLEEILAIDKEIAGHLGNAKNPYDSLLDLYEPDMTADECERLFSGVKKGLVPLIKKITKSKHYADSLPFLTGSSAYPKSDQEKLLHFIARQMGFDMSRGRIDVSPHPFTIELGENDVRLTTMYSEKDFRESFTSTMHEAGHGLYEQGVALDFAHTPLGSGVSLGIHEALSRFWENMVGKNPSFLTFMLPQFKAFYPVLQSIRDEDIMKAFNLVKPSLVRIHADEVTYSLHIILRFEMENALINGKVTVSDAPELWREKSKELFGIAAESDTEGILQDVHWTYGNFGYFPAYALGNLYGAQFLDTMKKDIQFDMELEKGNLIVVKDWLDTHIHQYGSLYMPHELVKRVTGKALDYTYFLNYLTEKYTSIYSV